MDPYSSALQAANIILPVSSTPTDSWMQHIVSRTKTHYFVKARHPSSVLRIWFYETGFISAITHICDIGICVQRPPQTSPLEMLSLDFISGTVYSFLPEDVSMGHTDFNNYTTDFRDYEYAYPIISCTRLTIPIPLLAMRLMYGMEGPPMEMVYVPEGFLEDVYMAQQEKLW